MAKSNRRKFLKYRVLKSTVSFLGIYLATRILDFYVQGSQIPTIIKALLIKVPIPILVIVAFVIYLFMLLKELSTPLKLTKQEVEHIFQDYDIYLNGTVEKRE